MLETMILEFLTNVVSLVVLIVIGYLLRKWNVRVYDEEIHGIISGLISISVSMYIFSLIFESYSIIVIIFTFLMITIGYGLHFAKSKKFL